MTVVVALTSHRSWMTSTATMILSVNKVQTQHQREMAGKITKTFCMVEAMRSLLRYLLLIQALFQREIPHPSPLQRELISILMERHALRLLTPLQREAATALMERYALGPVAAASARSMALLSGDERMEYCNV